MSKISHLKLNLDSFFLEIPNLEISDTGVTAIIGKSGSGKTTFFKTLLGLHQPPNWSWIFNNQEMAQLKIEERQLGVVFQNYELFSHLTAEENIILIMKSRKNYNSTSLEQLEYFKNKLDLEKCWGTLAKKLSGGEQQRVSLLRAILSNPRMILLDEPFSALDQGLKQSAYQIVQNVLSELNVPILMITHDVHEAKLFTDNIIELRNGKVV